MKFFTGLFCVFILLFEIILAEDKVALPDYTSWEKMEKTFIWYAKDNKKRGVLYVVFYNNLNQNRKSDTIVIFGHPNEKIQLAIYKINDHEDKEYFFEKKETDKNWLVIQNISDWDSYQLNDFLGKRYHFRLLYLGFY